MKRRTVLGAMATGALTLGAPELLHAATGEGQDALSRTVRAVNTARGGAGLSPLVPHAALMSTSRLQANFMRSVGHTTHLDATGAPPDLRAARLGYSGQILGETLAETYGPPEPTVQAWLQTPATRAVLINAEARWIGVAVAQGGEGGMWWSLLTAKPPTL